MDNSLGACAHRRLGCEVRVIGVRIQRCHAGTMTHNLEVQGQGIDQKLDHDLAPGETGTLQAELKPGKYQVFCPLDGHKDMGMKVDLTVHS